MWLIMNISFYVSNKIYFIFSNWFTCSIVCIFKANPVLGAYVQTMKLNCTIYFSLDGFVFVFLTFCCFVVIAAISGLFVSCYCCCYYCLLKNPRKKVFFNCRKVTIFQVYKQKMDYLLYRDHQLGFIVHNLNI